MNRLLFVLVAIFIGVPAHAALIDITVQGTWEWTDNNSTINPFGLVIGDTFIMRATYDDTSLFNHSDGVTAALDPSINPGTMLEVRIPHAAGAPNPLVFTHVDHISIGFAANAEIEFDGTDATTDPGVFRNFEMHVEFLFDGQQFDLDLYGVPGGPTSEIYNASEKFRIAAEGLGADHLEIIPVPAAAWLFGSALGILGWLKRRDA